MNEDAPGLSAEKESTASGFQLELTKEKRDETSELSKSVRFSHSASLKWSHEQADDNLDHKYDRQ